MWTSCGASGAVDKSGGRYGRSADGMSASPFSGLCCWAANLLLADQPLTWLVLQGVRTKTVKKSARTIVEKYYTRLTLDFHTNKRIVDDVAILPSKRMRNKIAGYTTHLMRRIAKGPVRGISLKLQEEERERRLDFVPEVSALEQETILIDPDTRDLLESLGYGNMNGVSVPQSGRD